MKKVRHGTIGAYTNDRCRCAECTKAQRDHAREYRNRIRPRLRKDGKPFRSGVAHGTITGYYLHRCRCAVCQDVARKYRVDYKERKLATALPCLHTDIAPAAPLVEGSENIR